MQTTYRSGRWYVVVLPGALVALPPEASAPVVAELWERMPQQPSLATVVDVLSADAGALAALPSFVAAIAEAGGIRIALRGGATARVTTPSGAEDFTGADVTTWSERFIVGASHVEVTVEADAEGTDADLPVHSGIVRAAAVRAALEPDDAPPPAAPVAGAADDLAALDEAPTEQPTPAEEQPAPAEQPAPDEAPVPATAAASADDGDLPAPEPAIARPEAALLVDDVATPSGEMTLAPPTEVTLAPPPEDVEQLWGATVHSVPAARADDEAPAVPADSVPPPALEELGDHDGATISTAALRAMRRQSGAPDDAPVEPASAPESAPTAATGRIRMCTGQVVTLDRTVIIGRRPRSTRASGANLPHLIAVDSPQQDISRSHLEIRPEGDTVVVIDLHTTNGSTLLRPGADPVRLHPGEPTLVLSGDVVDLGDGVEVAFEDLP